MARRSDMSQKLLDDLRMRKEKMAMSHTSGYSNQTPRGGNSRKPMQGSRTAYTRQTASSTMGDQNRWLSTTHNRPAIKEGASKEIVLSGRAQTSRHIGDLSRALAFALENSGTMRQLTSFGNPMLGILHHIGRSVDVVQVGRSSSSSSNLVVRNSTSNSHFPTLSHLHIKEISKGAQKLNQILNSCSNGLSFDRYSMDIGKELLKGAMELEESLRMLVNLQQESEYTISAQQKQRIRLLEDEDDEDESTIKVINHKQVNRPKFSFEGPTRSSLGDAQEVTKASHLKQRLLSLSNTRETAQFSSNNHISTTSSGSVSHRRSVSHGLDSSTLTASSEPMKHSNASHSKSGKERIPNVIAKLMGLEELPPNTDPKNGAEKSKPLKPEKLMTEGRVKKEERALIEYKSPSERNQTPWPYRLQANNHSTQRGSLGPAAEKFLVSHNGRLEFVFHDETTHMRGPNLKNVTLMSNSKPAAKTNRHQMNTNQLSKISGIQQDKYGKERKEEKPNPKDWKTTSRGVNGEPFSNHFPVPQVNKHLQAADYKHNKGLDKQHHKSRSQQKNAENFYTLINQQKVPHKGGSQHPQQFGSQGAMLHEDERRRHNTKSKSQVNNPKGRGKTSENALKPKDCTTNLQKKLPRTNHVTAGERSPKEAFDKKLSEESRKKSHNNLISDGITTNHKLIIDSLDESSETQKANDAKRLTSSPQHMLSEAMRVQLRQEKISKRDMHKRVDSQKRDGEVEEVLTQKNRSTNNTGQPLKQQTSVLQQLKQRNVEATHSTKEAEISMSRKANASESMNLVQHEKNMEATSTFNNPVGDSRQNQRKMDATAPHTIMSDETSGVSRSLLDLEPMVDKDEAVPSYTMLVQPKVPGENGMLGIFNSSHLDQHKSIREKSLLKKNENHLKQILLRSQIFLNTAEAFFGLLIPIDILHSSVKTCNDDDNKIVLDSCYEVMKRKGRREELTSYPFIRISVRKAKLKGLDDLVTELHEDLEELKFLDQDAGNKNDTALYLHRMLERDIQNKNPDLNCMWDFGWSEKMFGYLEKVEVIRDVEKFVLNGLIDEILEDIV